MFTKKRVLGAVSPNRSEAGAINLIIFAAVILWSGCSMPPYDKAAIEAKLQGDRKPAFHELAVDGRTIFYAETGDPDQPPVAFIHGTPGSWMAFGGYLGDDCLRRAAHMIAVDRPGFGRSGYKQVVPSLQEQAAMLAPVLRDAFKGRRAILVGHSLGAPIAVRLTMDYPDLVDGLVLVSPSIDPALEKPRWYNRVANWPFISWAIPTKLALANEELMPLEGELSKMLPLWQRVRAPVIVIQGQKDRLVSPASADFAERELGRRAKIIRVPDAGHFILWQQPSIISDAVLSLLGQDRSRKIS
jgi:pimeloyl-ACP methyl ester carboxylesterase